MQNSNNNKKTFIIILLLVAIVALLGYIAFGKSNNNISEDSVPNKKEYQELKKKVVTPDTINPKTLALRKILNNNLPGIIQECTVDEITYFKRPLSMVDGSDMIYKENGDFLVSCGGGLQPVGYVQPELPAICLKTINNCKNVYSLDPLNPIDLYNVKSSQFTFCPDQKTINLMPTQYSPENPSNEYYIYEGKRYEISDFNSEWIATNCSIKEQKVY